MHLFQLMSELNTASLGAGRNLRWLIPVLALVGALTGCGSTDSVDGIPKQVKQSPIPTSLPTFFVPAEVPSVYRFAKLSNGAYFYTGSEDEVRQILRDYPDFRFEGTAFEKDATGAGQAVYRFANLQTGGYFYTGSAVERDLVLRDYPHFRFEGSTFSVAPSSELDARPIFRLANTNNGSYLYTQSSVERDYAQSLGFWRSEGSTFKAALGSVLKNRSWRTGAALEQDDSPVDDFDVQIDDQGRAMAVYFKVSNGRRTLFATRGLPTNNMNVAWATPQVIDLDALGNRRSLDDTFAQGSVKPKLAMAANGNAYAVWSTQADCGLNNYQTGPLCSYLVGAAFSASTNSWAPAQLIASSDFGGDINVKVNSRGDVAVRYTGWQAIAGTGIENVPALLWRSATSVSTLFQKAVFPESKNYLTSAIRALGLDETGRLAISHADGTTLPAKIVAYRGHVNSGLGAQELVSTGGQLLHLGMGRNGRTVLAFIEYDGTDKLKAATTLSDSSGTWSTLTLLTANADFNNVRYNYADNNASFVSVDDEGNARIQSLRCVYFQFRAEAWRGQVSAPATCTPQGLASDPLIYNRNGDYVSIEKTSYGALRWLSYDAKRNLAIHPIDNAVALRPEDVFFKLVPTTPTSMALNWDRTKSAMSVNGTAVVVVQGGLDTLPTVDNSSGTSRACGNGVVCISNLWGFSFQ